MRVLLLALLLTASAQAQLAPFPTADELLPPLPSWSGKSESLVVPLSDPWVTPAEKAGFRTTPSYDETVAWLRTLVEAHPGILRMVSLGQSPQGRDLVMVIASKEGSFTPEALKRGGKPTLLAQAGIHAGEIDGKDAGMMLLRDIAARGTERRLLDGANLLFVPIFNVDGHERASRYTRPNQRGPENAGWRTTSRNLNLNRDYAKADTPEMRAMVAALDRWDPDLYLDIHVTDGADYQWDITYGFNGAEGWSPSIGEWLTSRYRPKLDRDLAAWGHVPGPLVFGVDDSLMKGLSGWVASPRFSQGYGDARHVPSMLVENHSLKPYRQRVLGTYVLVRSSLEAIAADREALREAIRRDRARRADPVPLDFKVPAGASPTIELLGIESRPRISEITGGVVLDWLGRPMKATVPYLAATEVSVSVARPKAWWIPPAWEEVIERLEIHGIRFERIGEPREVRVEMYRLDDPKFETRSFEGHVRVSATPRVEVRTETYPKNSVRVPADQPLGTLAALLLEPASEDSLFQWGFIPEPLERTEYIEGYAIEPLARRMLEADPELAEAFRQKLASDPEFRASERRRLEWFYERTPYFDERWRLYPIGREK